MALPARRDAQETSEGAHHVCAPPELRLSRRARRRRLPATANTSQADRPTQSQPGRARARRVIQRRVPRRCGPRSRETRTATMAERLVLHPPSALIERLVRQAHDVERVSDLDGVGEHRVEHRLVGRGQIERRPGDPGPPRRRVGRRARRTAPPRHARRRRRGAARGARRRSGSTTLPAERAVTGEQGLVQPERVHGAEAGRVVDRAAGRTPRRRPSRCASPSSSRARPPTPSGRDGRPAPSPTARPASSTRSVSTRSAGPARSTHARHVGQRHRCLRHTSRAGRPNTGRSTSTTSRTP